jgi:hypothetical protein
VVDAGILEFGDRAGSYLAFLLFASVFAVLGFGVWREIRRRAPQQRRTAVILGALLFAGPLTLVYTSSLNGFYEADVRGGRLLLHYLYPMTTEVRLDDIASVRAAPAFRGRWRLYVTDTRGVEYASATWRREAVQEGAARLQLLVRKQE